MAETAGGFPFHRLKWDKYLILDVMMYVGHQEVLKFMFAVNKDARGFLQQNFTTILNGFNNEGLIPYYFGGGNHYSEKLFYHFE